MLKEHVKLARLPDTEPPARRTLPTHPPARPKLRQMVCGFFQPLESMPKPIFRYPLTYVSFHTYAFNGEKWAPTYVSMWASCEQQTRKFYGLA